MSVHVETVKTFADDLDGKPFTDGESIAFAVRGVKYVIDLASPNVAKFDKALAPFLKVARETGTQATTASRSDLERVRAWARENGHNVKDRGRVAAEVLDAYDNAHAQAVPAE